MRLMPEKPTADTLKAYRQLRFAVGLMGLLLPAVLLAFPYFTLGHGLGLTSISGAHYSDDYRDYFSGTLFAIGVFLAYYPGFGWLDRIAGLGAWVSAWGVALRPTAPDCNPSTEQLQVAVQHRYFATAFFVCLIVFCFSFSLPWPKRWKTWIVGIIDAKSPVGAYGPPVMQFLGIDGTSTLDHLTWARFWRNVFFLLCAAAMAVCCIAIYFFWQHHSDRDYFCATPSHTPSHAVFWLESLAIWAFAWAWLVKGALRQG